MSEQNVELVRSLQPSDDDDLVALFRDEGTALMESLAPFVHDDFEIVAPSGIQPGRRTGLAGLRAGWLDWLEPWESYRVEVEDLIEAGDEIVVLVRDYGRRVGVTQEISVVGAAVWTVRDGKVARVAFYLNRSEALEAAGLSEQDART
jgi:ketosteroid isomerase-like protein